LKQQDKRVETGHDVTEIARHEAGVDEILLAALAAGAAPQACAERLLVTVGRSERVEALEAAASSFGSFVASRARLCRLQLSTDTGCLYALADAVRGVSPLDVIRWRCVVSAMDWGDRSDVVTGLLQQSRAVEDLLIDLSDDSCANRELALLCQHPTAIVSRPNK
jgi:hypothetical protein